ncbi:hypothetical protein BG015_004870 [Linnemannia schmuckeri]|uniref:Ser-Thr-rich glycosyl-phosphatidyl-inositol-anchored membrane family-domain-containing protein n=1 Tax=Linnemannia schmuckeri TaxID=64567 RepID=A0A9P5R834_9FUNG|nr:hypothetical protein BG015_004870 [Linnemannia schmuckeri]
MKSTTALLSVLAASASVVLAQSPGADEGRLYYTEPTSATIWTAGTNATVSWSNVCKPENTGDLEIVLYIGTGGANGTEQVRVPGIANIGVLNCLKSKSATVFLPANLTTSNKYAIHVDTEPLQSYSSPFSIKGIDPPVTTTAAPVAPTTTGAAVPPTGASTTAAGGPVATGDKSASAAGSLKTLGASAAVLAVTIGAFFF